MKIHAISDIHVDYQENWEWVSNISRFDYQDDILILAGDITDETLLIKKVFRILKKSFKEVFFVPGNHDLWTIRNEAADSLTRFETLLKLSKDYGIRTTPMVKKDISIIPLFAWYDYSFASISGELYKIWRDFIACKWPDGYDENKITRHFLSLNEPVPIIKNKYIISFSHFLPRIDLMPSFIPYEKRMLYPVFGSSRLEKQIRQLGSHLHVYGHSHFNLQVKKDNTLYINNAFGYPGESYITLKRLQCIHDSEGSNQYSSS